jgi:hypothetical protein
MLWKRKKLRGMSTKLQPSTNIDKFQETQYISVCSQELWPLDHRGGLVEVEVNLRPTVSRPVCLGVRHPSATSDQLFFLREISFRQLQVCYFVAPSLTRGQVYNLLYNSFWALQSSHSWVEVSQNSRPYFTVSSETPPTWRARFPYLYPPGTRWPSYTPGHWVPFLSPLTTRRAMVEVS